MAIRPLFMRGVSLTASAALTLTGLVAVAVATAASAEAGAVTAHFCPKAPGVTVVGTDATTGYPICQQLFNESGTFTVPFDVSAVDVVLAGGGGGGGGGGTDAFGAVLAGGGGAGGSVALYKDLAVTPGTPVAVTVGAGGANGVGGSATDITTWTGTNGSAGGDSAFGAWSTPGGGGGTAAGSDGSVITVGTGGSTAAGSNIIGSSAAQDGGNPAVIPSWDVNNYFTAAGGGAGAGGVGADATYGTFDGTWAASFGGDGGAGFIPFEATTLFPDATWVSILDGSDVVVGGGWDPTSADLTNFGFGPGAGGASSGIDTTDPVSVCGSGVYLDGTRNSSGYGNGGSVNSHDLTAPDWGQCGTWQDPTFGAGGGGGVGYSAIYAIRGGADLSGGAGGLYGAVVVRYLAGPLAPCVEGSTMTTTVTEGVAEVVITGSCAFTAPAGVSSYDMVVVGGGGGGGFAASAAGGGGGGGQVALCTGLTGAANAVIGTGGESGMPSQDGTATEVSDAASATVCSGAGGKAGVWGLPWMNGEEVSPPSSGAGGETGNAVFGGGSGSISYLLDSTLQDTTTTPANSPGYYYFSAAAGGGAGDSAAGSTPAGCEAGSGLAGDMSAEPLVLPVITGPTSLDCGSSEGGVGTEVGTITGASTSAFADDTRVLGGGGGGGNNTAGQTTGGLGGGADGGSSAADSGPGGTASDSTGGGGGGGYAGDVMFGMNYGEETLIIGDNVPQTGGSGGNGAVILRYTVPSSATLYVVPDAQPLTYGGGAPTYGYTLHTGSPTGPAVTPTLTTAPTCTSDYVAFSPTTGKVANSPRTITCSGASDAGYTFDYTSTADLSIAKATAVCTVTPYTVTYNAISHTASGSCTGVGTDGVLTGLVVSGTTHTAAGTYATDPWAFTDTTGNYSNDSGTVSDKINAATMVCKVKGYTLTYDGLAHKATVGSGDEGHEGSSSCTGLGGVSVRGVTVSGTTHTNVGSYSDTAIVHDPSGNYADVSIPITDVIKPLSTNIVYNGTQWIALSGTSMTPSVSGLGARCTGSVSYSLDTSPFTGLPGPYALSVVDGNVSTIGWLPGAYLITAAYAGDGNCVASSDISGVTVGVSTSGSAWGGGYVNSSPGKANFGFEVQSFAKSGLIPASVKGQLAWVMKGNWKFKGTLTSYSLNTSTGIGTARGTGSLFYWSKTTLGGSWVAATTGVASVTITFTATTASTRTKAATVGSFGIAFTGTKASGAPSLPTFAKVNIASGNIKTN